LEVIVLSIQNNSSGAFRIRWPKTDAEIIALGEAFIAYESGLSALQQLKDISLTDIQAAHTSALASVSEAGTGEAARAIASETLRQKVELAKFHLDFAISHLKVKYRANLAQLELWGLETVTGPSGIKIRRPRTQSEWLAFLWAYVPRESGLPVADQLPLPPLAELQALKTDIQAALIAREEGRTTREVSVQGRSASTKELDELLRIACVLIVKARFNGQVTNELQRWGFLVQARPVPGGNGQGTLPGTPPEGDPPSAS
jgi:hypothetical protein